MGEAILKLINKTYYFKQNMINEYMLMFINWLY